MPKSKPGCFTGIFRRMLCTGNARKHPSSSSSSSSSSKDHITKPNNEREDHHTKTKRQSGPTLVARLMGLDSMPPNTNFSLKTTTPESLSRSRSVNFADYLLKLDVAESEAHSHHRRARTSVSFREVPPPTTSFRRNDVSEANQKGKRSEQSERLKGKRENEKRISKLKNEPRRTVLPKASKKICERRSGVLGSVVPRESKCSQRNGYGAEKLKVSKRENGKKVTEKFVRKRKNQLGKKKIQPIESNQENLSPVSVLDDTLFSERHPMPVEDLELNMKLAPKVAYHIGDDSELRSAEKKNYGKNTGNKGILLDYSELADQLLNLTKQDLSESYWISNTNNNVIDFEGFEEICKEFEGLILDVLLQEVTSEILQI